MALSDDWVVGFVDGEGCFSYSLCKSSKLKFGYQIQGEFTVVQHKRDIKLLNEFIDHFKCGSVARNHGDRYHYRVKDRASLINIIIPYFEEHNLKTNKQFQLPIFKEITLGLEAQEHFTQEGHDRLAVLVKQLSALKKAE